MKVLVVCLALFAGCSGTSDIEGEWRFDSTRFDELAVVRRASVKPLAQGLGGDGDMSERARVLRLLELEARVTRVTIERRRMVVATDTGKHVMPFMSERADKGYRLAITEKGEVHYIVATRTGEQLTLARDNGDVLFVLRKRN